MLKTVDLTKIILTFKYNYHVGLTAFFSLICARNY
jgi:hypothetical protein